MYVCNNCRYVLQIIRTTYPTRLDKRSREDETLEKVALTSVPPDTLIPAVQTEGKFPFYFHLSALLRKAWVDFSLTSGIQPKVSLTISPFHPFPPLFNPHDTIVISPICTAERFATVFDTHRKFSI